MNSQGERNFYTILQVSRQVTTQEIKKSFHKISLQIHPDKVEESKKEEAKIKFQELSTAYETLSNPEKREKYDLELVYGEQKKKFTDSAEDNGEGFFFKASKNTFDFKAYRASGAQNIYNNFMKKFAEQNKSEIPKSRGGFNC